jgi:hypothetical protein
LGRSEEEEEERVLLEDQVGVNLDLKPELKKRPHCLWVRQRAYGRDSGRGGMGACERDVAVGVGLRAGAAVARGGGGAGVIF